MGRTGLIPAKFADQVIKYRIPYSMPGELQVAANQTGQFFPEAVFLHNVDKPFEIWSVRVTLTALLAGVILAAQPGQDSLRRRIRLRIADTSKNENLTKAVQLVDTLVNPYNYDAAWEWFVPYSLVRSEGFQVGVDSLGFDAAYDAIRVNIAFQGYLTVIQPASETR
jgi:hypothetical protein